MAGVRRPALSAARLPRPSATPVRRVQPRPCARLLEAAKLLGPLCGLYAKRKAFGVKAREQAFNLLLVVGDQANGKPPLGVFVEVVESRPPCVSLCWCRSCALVVNRLRVDICLLLLRLCHSSWVLYPKLTGMLRRWSIKLKRPHIQANCEKLAIYSSSRGDTRIALQTKMQVIYQFRVIP